ncbi:MAG: hypothetical protein ACK4VZ_03415 [Paracoccaceae bacterium]
MKEEIRESAAQRADPAVSLAPISLVSSATQHVSHIVKMPRECDICQMNLQANPFAIRRRAFFAWTVVLSLALVWIGVQPRPTDFSTHSARGNLSALLAADPVATLSAAGKTHRSPEVGQGGDNDFALLAYGLLHGAIDLGRDIGSYATDEPCPASHCTLPEPRAPPRI